MMLKKKFIISEIIMTMIFNFYKGHIEFLMCPFLISKYFL